MPLVVPHDFAGAGVNTPTLFLDENNTAIRDYINLRNPTVGSIAARPAAGNPGAIYVASDQGNATYVDNGSTWVLCGVSGIIGRATHANLSGSAAETSLLTQVIAGGTLAGIIELEVRSTALLLNNSGATNGVTYRIKFAGVTIATLATGLIAANATSHGVWVESHLRFVAGGGTPPWNVYSLVRLANVGVSGTSVGQQLMDMSVGSSAGLGTISPIVNQTLDVTAQLTAAHAQLQLLDISTSVEVR